MAYAKSLDVRVYPTAWRGANAATEQTFNPEASLNTEENLSNLSNRLAKVNESRLDSYVVSYNPTTDKSTFVIHGYIFELSNVSSLGTPLWAKIQLLSAPATYKGREFTNATLACFDNGSSSSEPAVAVLDMKDGAGTTDGDYYFHGLQFSNTRISGDAANGSYVLKLLDNTGHVPAESWLVLDTSQVKDVSSGNPLTETMTTGSIYAGTIVATSTAEVPVMYTSCIYGSNISVVASGQLSVNTVLMNLFASGSMEISTGKTLGLYASESLYINTKNNLWFDTSKSMFMNASSNISVQAANIYATTVSTNPTIQLSASYSGYGKIQLVAGSSISMYAGNSINFYINNKLIKVPSGSSATLARVYDSTYNNKDRVYEAHRLVDDGAGTLTTIGNASKAVYFNQGRPTTVRDTIQSGYGYARRGINRWFIEECLRNNSPDKCAYNDSNWKDDLAGNTIYYTYTRIGNVLNIHLQTSDFFDVAENDWIRIDLKVLLCVLKSNGSYVASQWKDELGYAVSNSIEGWNSNPLVSSSNQLSTSNTWYNNVVISNQSFDLSSGDTRWCAFIRPWYEHGESGQPGNVSLFIGKEAAGTGSYGWSCDISLLLTEY